MISYRAGITARFHSETDIGKLFLTISYVDAIRRRRKLIDDECGFWQMIICQKPQALEMLRRNVEKVCLAGRRNLFGVWRRDARRILQTTGRPRKENG